MDADKADVVGQIIAGVAVASLLLGQWFWETIKTRYKEWSDYRVARRRETREMAARVARIEESTVNTHSTNLRDDVDSLTAKVAATMTSQEVNSRMLQSLEKKIDFIATAVQDMNERQALSDRDRQELAVVARRDHQRFDREFKEFRGRIERLEE